eukprot:GEMP01032092.1.p1 GENE.GEMP01032092.1~~GEMP01032092.1.p1  ORF type:complete len:240 (-),score=72.36 GEMP01032092.1:1176-1895(-)
MAVNQYVMSHDGGFCIPPPRPPGKKLYTYWFRMQEEDLIEKYQDERLTVLKKHADELWAKKRPEEIAEIQKAYELAMSKYECDLREWLNEHQQQAEERACGEKFTQGKYIPEEKGLMREDSKEAGRTPASGHSNRPEENASNAAHGTNAAQKEGGESLPPKRTRIKEEDEPGKNNGQKATQDDDDTITELRAHMKKEVDEEAAAAAELSSMMHNTAAMSVDQLEALRDSLEVVAEEEDF